ncbi:MAG: ABC transporter substrate-binding protein [Patescibacteria group bacterium]
MKNIYKVIGIVLIALIVIVVAVNTKKATPTDKPVVKIGFVLPLSGGASYLGEGMRRAAELAAKEVKASNTKYNYEVTFEDDAFTPAKTASAVNKLISVDHVDVVSTVASAAGVLTNPIAEKAKIVHISTASDPAIARGEYNFTNWTPPVEEVKVFIAEAQKRGIKKISIFGQTISGITAQIDELKKQLPGTGISIVSEDISNFGTKDFRTAIQKAKSANPDYFLVLMFSPELEILANQIKELNVKIPVTAIESFELSDNPGLYEGLWYVNAADPTQEFADSYFKEYGKTVSIGTPNAYDIVKMVVATAETFDGKTKPTTTELAQKLAQLKGYNGALGNNISIGPDHVVITKAVLRTIKDGKPTTISQ